MNILLKKRKTKIKQQTKTPKTKGNWMSKFSKLSKAFLLPIALLPIAGLFLAIGATITSKTDPNSGAWIFGNIINQMGNIAFSNLPVLFCISVAIAYTDDAGVAGITALVGFLVFNAIQLSLLSNGQVTYQYIVNITVNNSTYDYTFTHQFFNGTDLNKSILDYLHTIFQKDIQITINSINSITQIVQNYNLLFYKGSAWAIQPALLTPNLGINSLNSGVFGGIIVGALAAYLYNKFYKTQLPSALSFFSGTKLVPIITFAAVIPLSFIFMITWPLIGSALTWFGNESGKLPAGLDSLVFEIFERSLVPFGLHHVFYAPLWWTQAGGSISDALTNIKISNNETIAQFNAQYPGLLALIEKLPFYTHNPGDSVQQIITNWENSLLTETKTAVGDQTMMYKVLGDPNINFTILQKIGLNLGRFQSGKFPFMMFGLPAAACAMWFSVPKENRKKIMGIYFSAAFTCFLTGITEPIEYTFLFVAPWLFYGIHMPLCAISFMLMGLLHVHVSMTVSGGFIDFLVFGIIPFIANKGTNFWWILIIGFCYIPLYFFSFYFFIKWRNIKVPGRENNISQLYTKADYRAKNNLEPNANKENNTADPKRIKAEKIIEFLGGPDNITSVDSCASRLRVTVIDNTKVNPDGIKSLGGCNGVLVKGQSIQAIYGGEQEVIKPYMKEILKKVKK